MSHALMGRLILGLGVVLLTGGGVMLAWASAPAGAARPVAIRAIHAHTASEVMHASHVAAPPNAATAPALGARGALRSTRLPMANRSRADVRVGRSGAGAVGAAGVAGRERPAGTRAWHGAASIGGAGNVHPGAHGGMRDGTAGVSGSTMPRQLPR